MRPSETKQTGGSDRPCAILPCLVALQKRVDLKGCRLFRNKAWSVAKSQSHRLSERAQQTRRKYDTWFGQNPCHVFQTQGFMGSYFLLWLPWC